jgi:dipeptidyl aminopeptidase/acylaminoacyl peptidase
MDFGCQGKSTSVKILVNNQFALHFNCENLVSLVKIKMSCCLALTLAFLGCQNSSSVTDADAKPSVPAKPLLSAMGKVIYGATNYKFKGDGPGQSTQMKVYLPKGEHAEASLACVFVAPAGTNLLTGSDIPRDYHDESLPYAEAGFAVVQYSLDGPMPEGGAEQELAVAYKQFKAASAGLENTKQAIKFVKTHFPEVDIQRLYTAGHSSAGTVSLLAASAIPEIKGAIAYAPCSDPEEFHRELSQVPETNDLLPGCTDFIREYSPLRKVGNIKCPVFLFQAADDQVVVEDETERFAKELKRENSSVSVVKVASGGHYNSMIQEGIPAAIKWLKSLDASN